MTVKPNNDQPEQQPAEQPRVIITFAGPSLAEANITHDPLVTDGQLFLAAYLLDLYAQEVRAKLVARQEQAKLVTAAGLPAGIRPIRQ